MSVTTKYGVQSRSMTSSIKRNVVLYSVDIMLLILLVSIHSIGATVMSENSYNLTSRAGVPRISLLNTSHTVTNNSENTDYLGIWKTETDISEVLPNNSVKLVKQTSDAILRSISKDLDLNTSVDTPLYRDWSTSDNDRFKITKSSITSTPSTAPTSSRNYHSVSSQSNLSYETVTSTETVSLVNLASNQNKDRSSEYPTILAHRDRGTDIHKAPLSKNTGTKTEIRLRTKHTLLTDLAKNPGVEVLNNTALKVTIKSLFYNKSRQSSKLSHDEKEAILRDEDIDETPNWIVSFHHYSRSHGPVSVAENKDTAVFWRNEKYILAVIIPIGAGIIVTCVIVAAAYFLRVYRVQRRRRNIDRMSRRMVRPRLLIKDRAMLLDENSEDDF